MLWRYLYTLIAIAGLSGCGQQDLTLTAPPGEFRIYAIGTESTQSSFPVKLTLESLDRHSKWPPAAYVGFYQGEDRNNSVQFVLIQKNADDDGLISGYRIIEEGKEVKVITLDTIKEDHSVEVSMMFSDGVATIGIEGGLSNEERTNLKSVTPYVSVSSGSARFDFSP